MKRICKVWLCVSSATLAIMASFADTEVVDGYTWTYQIYGDTAKIYNYDYVAISPEPIGFVTIPATLGGKHVTSIGDHAFDGCSDLTSVTIPNSVTNIGESAFRFCHSLTSVDIPEGVVSIGGGAFSYSGLADVAIPNSVTRIGVMVFDVCSNLKSATIGNGITNFGHKVFAYCDSLTNVVISPRATNIGDYMFVGCSGLTSVTIPDNVKSIESCAFEGCSGLTSVAIPDSVTSIGDDVFSGCSGLTNVVIGASVTSIGDGAFAGCAGLTSVTMPDGVTSIGSRAFFGTPFLSNQPNGLVIFGKVLYIIKGACSDSVTIPNSVTCIGDSAFRDCSGLMSITIPDSVASIGSSAFRDCSGLASVTIGNGVTSIGELAFDGCSGLRSVTIPGSVTSIGDSAFSGCSGLTSVTVPGWKCEITFDNVTNLVISEGTTSIGEGAFSGCSGLTSVTIPDSVTNIGYWAFSGCSGLTSVTIPDSVTSTGDCVFEGCNGLTSVTIGNGVTGIGDWVFKGCNGLKNVMIGAGVTSIGWEAFSNCSGLTSYVVATGNLSYKSQSGLLLTKDGKTLVAVPRGLASVTIPDSVTSIAWYAFFGCCGLTSVTIPDSVTNIGESAFSGCIGLTSVTIPDSVTGIEWGAFSGCSGITSVTVPGWKCEITFDNVTNLVISEGTTSIGDGAFSNCSGLTSVTIPDSVTNIGNWAFSGCSCLTSVTIPSSVTNIGDGAFSGCSGLASVTVPDSVTSIGASAFSGCSGLTSVAIPSSVTNVGAYAFSGCSGLKDANGFVVLNGVLYGYLGTGGDVTIPDGVTSIRDRAFEGCIGLTSVMIPGCVTSIGDYAFSYCSGLTSVSIPVNVTNIGEHAFYKCSGLTNVTVPGWKCRIPFDNVTNLVISAGTTSIGDGAFSGCGVLTSVTIGKGVTYVDNSMFLGCNGLMEYRVSPDNECYSSKNGLLLSKDAKTLILPINGDVTIPDSVTNIDDYAFWDCSGLASVTIGSGVTSIGKCAFEGCSGLTSVTIGNGATSIGEYAFYGCSGLASVTIGSSVTSIEEFAFYGCSGLASVTIPVSVMSIGWAAFSGCSGLTSVTLCQRDVGRMSELFPDAYDKISVTIADTVDSIAGGAFDGCAKVVVDKTTVPGVRLVNGWAVGHEDGISGELDLTGVRGIADYAFEGCDLLTHVKIPNGVKAIGSYAFSGCRGMRSVQLPPSVARIGGGAFYGCDGLGAVVISAVAAWARIRFGDGSANPLRSAHSLYLGDRLLTDVTLPGDIVHVGEYQFAGASSITNFVLLQGVESIGGSAFEGCQNLLQITIPSSVTNIGQNAFSDTSSLAVVNAESVEAWCKISFDGELANPLSSAGHLYIGGCLLTEIIIPDDIDQISQYAFSGCRDLTYAVVPVSVIGVGTCAFKNCSNLKWVWFEGNSPAVEDDIYAGTPDRLTTYAPDGSTGWLFMGSATLPDKWPQNDGSARAIAHGVYDAANPPRTLTFMGNLESLYDGYVDSPEKLAVLHATTIGEFPSADDLYRDYYTWNSWTIDGSTWNKLDDEAWYTFKGWWTDAIGGEEVSTATVARADATYYAHWLKFFELDWDPAGGWFVEYGSSIVTNGCKIAKMASVNLDGYAFVGWFTASDDGEQITEDTIIQDRTKLYAHWKVNKYTMTFDANGGEGGWSMSMDYGAVVVAPTVTREGYTFAGWSPAVPATVPAANATYTAQWTKNRYSVTFNPNGGSVKETKRTLDWGAAAGELPKPTRTGYVFAGWWTAAEGGVKVNASYVVDSSITLYAHWISDANIVIDTEESYDAKSDGSFELALSDVVYSGSTPRFTVRGLPTGLRFDAKTGVISGKATKPGTYKVTVSATNATVKKPVTAEFEIVVPNLKSEKLPGLEQDTKAYGTVMCGVALPTDLVDCTPEDGWTVKAAGLPAGLKFTAKDVIDPKTKQVTAPANTIYGVPTKAGAFTVTFTATKRGESNQVATITLRVEALPAWAQGSFTGYVAGDGGDHGFATMTVTANGRISGKVALGGTNWTFSATSYDATSVMDSGDDGACVFVVKSEAKAGKVVKPIVLEVRCGGEVESLANGVAEGVFCDGEVKMRRGMWKDKATAAAAKATIEKFIGVYTVSVANGADYGSGYLSLTVGKDGSVRATGKLADGTGVTATSPLMYDADAGWFVLLYVAPPAYKGGSFAAAVGFGDRLSPVLFTPQWTSRNPQASGEYGEGFERDVDLVGAYYNKLDTLHKYYDSLRLELNGSPELGFILKETSLNEQGRKVTTSSASTASAIDTFWQSGFVAAVNEKGAIVVEKATRPVQDKETKEWSYEGANDGALTLSFTQATGIFRGSYTFWYDYVSAYDETTDKETMAHASKKASFEGILVQGEDPKMDGFYPWDASSEYEDEKTGKVKTYKYKQSFPVLLLRDDE